MGEAHDHALLFFSMHGNPKSDNQAHTFLFKRSFCKRLHALLTILFFSNVVFVSRGKHALSLSLFLTKTAFEKKKSGCIPWVTISVYFFFCLVSLLRKNNNNHGHPEACEGKKHACAAYHTFLFKRSFCK